MTAYDPNGAVKSVSDTTISPVIATHNDVTDLQGHVLFNGHSNQDVRALVVDGETVGRYGVATTIDDKTQQVWNFGFGFDTLEADSKTSGTRTVGVQAAETLDELADASYGDSRLWRRIAAANGLAGDVALQRGERVVLPGVSGQPRDDLRTHAIDDESAIIGKTVPFVLRGARTRRWTVRTP